jgi:hypothetical protein
MQQIREEMYEIMGRAQQKSLDQANKKSSTPQYETGDHVFIREHVRGKLDPFWDHTGTVIERINEVDYLIEFDDPECRRHPVIHASHLKPRLSTD